LLRSRDPEADKQALLDRAERHFTDALRIQPDDVDARMNLGLVYLERERWLMAAMQLRQALSLAPSNPFVHYNLGIALRRGGDPNGASLHFAEAVRLNPLFDDARRELADTLAVTTQRADASVTKP
jgi:Flp pilus assembly protein TadD